MATIATSFERGPEEAQEQSPTKRVPQWLWEGAAPAPQHLAGGDIRLSQSGRSSESVARSSQSDESAVTMKRSLFVKKIARSTQEVTKAITDIIDRDFDDFQGFQVERVHSRKRDLQRLSTNRTSRTIPPVGGLPLLRFRMQRLLVSRFFDMMIGIVIIANSITIGIELTHGLEGTDASIISTLENIYLGIYVLEIALRLFAMGFACFQDNWFRFDAVLVFTGIVNTWIVPVVMSQLDWEGLQFLMIMRMLRLSRLARTVRLLSKFQVLWMLVRGLLSSASTMFYTLFLLSIVLYVFAALGVELITKHSLVSEDEEFRTIVASHFDSLFGTMLTLVQFVCLDSVSTIYRPLIKKDVTLLAYFVAVILVVPIVLMNLVTAIIVNSALEQASADKEVQRLLEEKKKGRLVKQLKAMFVRLDDDNSGEVTAQEIVNIDEEDITVLRDATGMKDPLEVFNLLNIDERDSLSIDEFCDGIWTMATSKAPIEVQRMEAQVQLMFKRVKSIEKGQRSIEKNQVMTNLRLDKLLAHFGQLDRSAIQGQVPARISALKPSSSYSSLNSATGSAKLAAAAPPSPSALARSGSSKQPLRSNSYASSGSWSADSCSGMLAPPTCGAHTASVAPPPLLPGIEETAAESLQTLQALAHASTLSVSGQSFDFEPPPMSLAPLNGTLIDAIVSGGGGGAECPKCAPSGGACGGDCPRAVAECELASSGALVTQPPASIPAPLLAGAVSIEVATESTVWPP